MPRPTGLPAAHAEARHTRVARPPRICLITGSHLCRNPRLVKEASTLAEAGYRVETIGPSTDAELAASDAAIVDGRWQHTIPVNLGAKGASALRARAVRRLGRELVRHTGLELPASLGYAVGRTLSAARQTRADLYIGHEEVGLWVVERLARAGARTGADLEDWYSQDLLPADRRLRPLRLLRACESHALHRGGHLTTTSNSLASALAQTYGGTPPRVIYNAFPWADRAALDGRTLDRHERSRPSLHWVSQVIGPGRGLEQLLGALAHLTVCVDVHLRGACSAVEEARLRGCFPSALGHRLFLHAPVPAHELLSRIAEHDIGLALELPTNVNRKHTVSNKILHYLLAGLAVVATDTEGQREVAERSAGAVQLCGSGEEESLAGALATLLASPERLRHARAAALESARTCFCWEQQAPVLLQSVERALAPATSPGDLAMAAASADAGVRLAGR